MPWYEADAVRLSRLKGKKMALKIRNSNKAIVTFVISEITLHIAENELIMKPSPFFYE